jgi:glyoxylase I family protein
MPSITGASHVALTVRDMAASAKWYSDVFGWQAVRRLSEGEAGSPRILLFDPQSSFVVAVCEPRPDAADRFDHRRVGLDHLALAIADEAALQEWVDHLDALGVAHSPIREFGPARFLTLDDPDGIQIELWLQL